MDSVATDIRVFGSTAVQGGLHIAFAASDTTTVDDFYAAEERDNGPPGIRTRYHPSSYAAYVLDPEGNNIEVVCQNARSARVDMSRIYSSRDLIQSRRYDLMQRLDQYRSPLSDTNRLPGSAQNVRRPSAYWQLARDREAVDERR
jgi:hypothetical protein